VIAGHQRAGRHDGPEIIEETRQYIRDFDRIVERTETARELYDQMLAIYPERVNPGMLWWSARTLKPLKRLLGVGMTSESSKSVSWRSVMCRSQIVQ
jgi:hypothetical protein